jgi:branched-chain amino acid transport system substrate-binding protein
LNQTDCNGLAPRASVGGKLGKDVERLFASTNASPDSALRAAEKLVGQDKVSIIVDLLSGSEGIAIRD